MVAVYGEVKSMRRIDLTDVAFCLVARFSTISRLENAVAVCEFLTENFHTNIYLWEFDEHSNHFAERIIPAGSPVTPPENVPYRPSIDPNEYTLEEINHFIGWSISNDSTTDVTNLSRILASEELTFYAKFEKANVYDYPLTNDDLIMETGTYKGTEGLYVGLKASRGIKGKICFPKTAVFEGNTYNVIGFLQGTILNDDSSNNNGLSWNQDIYAIFFEGCN